MNGDGEWEIAAAGRQRCSPQEPVLLAFPPESPVAIMITVRCNLVRCNLSVRWSGCMMKRHGLAYWVFIVMLSLYVASYIAVSRPAYQWAERYGYPGFYYVNPPQDTHKWRRMNTTLVWIYIPLNAVDRLIGTGRSPASEPLWQLSGVSPAPRHCDRPRIGRYGLDLC